MAYNVFREKYLNMDDNEKLALSTTFLIAPKHVYLI